MPRRRLLVGTLCTYNYVQEVIRSWPHTLAMATASWLLRGGGETDCDKKFFWQDRAKQGIVYKKVQRYLILWKNPHRCTTNLHLTLTSMWQIFLPVGPTHHGPARHEQCCIMQRPSGELPRRNNSPAIYVVRGSQSQSSTLPSGRFDERAIEWRKVSPQSTCAHDLFLICFCLF